MCLMLHEMKGWTACQQQRSLMGLSPQAVQCSGLARRYFRTTATPATGSSTHTKKSRCYHLDQKSHGVTSVGLPGLSIPSFDMVCAFGCSSVAWRSALGIVMVEWLSVTTPDTGIQVGCPFLSWLLCFRSNSLPVYQGEQK